MKSSTEDKIEGGARTLKGKAKKQAGKALNNQEWVEEGVAEEAAGKVQKKVGDIKKVFNK